MRARSPALASISVVVLSMIAAACGSSSAHAHAHAAVTSTTIAPSTTSTTVARSTTTRATIAPTTTAPITSPPTAAPTTAAPPPTTEPAPPPLLVTQLSGIGSANQVIAVSASSYGTDVATLTAYQRGASGWTQVFGPWFANIGRNGVAPPGAKREGDGRTPSGVYGFDFMFGVDANPGMKFPFRAITGSNIVWDDDPASPNYNEWIDTGTASAGASPEPMNVSAYDAGAVIAYNDARTPGLGSAIFLHVSSGRSTAGCVSLPISELLEVLRWLDPAQSPRIAIGTPAALTS